MSLKIFQPMKYPKALGASLINLNFSCKCTELFMLLLRCESLNNTVILIRSVSIVKLLHAFFVLLL